MNAHNQPFSENFIGVALLSLAGPFIWVLHFAVVYGVQHIACARLGNRAEFWIETSIILATVVALLALVLLMFKTDSLQSPSDGPIRQETATAFLSGVMRLLAFLSFLGVLFSGITVFFLPACGSIV
jgi:high-affinity Fe2+/Pb2+ permease